MENCKLLFSGHGVHKMQKYGSILYCHRCSAIANTQKFLQGIVFLPVHPVYANMLLGMDVADMLTSFSLGHNKQGDHSPDTLKFADISLTTCGTHAHVKCYSQHACSTSFNVNYQTI